MEHCQWTGMLTSKFVSWIFSQRNLDLCRIFNALNRIKAFNSDTLPEFTQELTIYFLIQEIFFIFQLFKFQKYFFFFKKMVVEHCDTGLHCGPECVAYLRLWTSTFSRPARLMTQMMISNEWVVCLWNVLSKRAQRFFGPSPHWGARHRIPIVNQNKIFVAFFNFFLSCSSRVLSNSNGRARILRISCT